jgi:hypothetical protein
MRTSNATEALRIIQPPGVAIGGPEDGESIGVDDHLPLVPEGAYQARYISHQTAVMFVQAAKVALRFEICEGPLAGVRLDRYFRVKRLDGKPGPRGKFKLSARGDLYRTLARLLDTKTRPDRISLQPLRHMLFRIHVRTVTRDRNGSELPRGCTYSVIDRI